MIKSHTSEIYMDIWICAFMMTVNLILIDNREVFGIRASIPGNSNAELKKQMVIVQGFRYTTLPTLFFFNYPSFPAG